MDRGHDVKTQLKSCLQLQIAGLERAFAAYDVHLNGPGGCREHQAGITKVIHSALALVDVIHGVEAHRVRQQQKSARLGLGLGQRLAAPAKREYTPNKLSQRRLPQQRIVEERRVAVAFDQWRRSVWYNGASPAIGSDTGHTPYSLSSGSRSQGSRDRDKSVSFRDSLDGEDEYEGEAENDGEYEEEGEDELLDPVIFDAGTGAPISLAQLWMDQQQLGDKSEMRMEKQAATPTTPPVNSIVGGINRGAEGSPLDDLDLMQGGYELPP